MTLQEILNYVDRKYPNQETVANKVIDLNKLQSEIFMKLNRLSNTYNIDTDTVTVADQKEYEFPTGVRIEDIVKVEVESFKDSGHFEEYLYQGVKDILSRLMVFTRGEDSTKYCLYYNRLPLDTADRIIKLHYFPRPELLSEASLSAVPSLDAEYHPLLCYGLITELASQGHNPDTEISDYYQRKYDEFFREVTHSLGVRSVATGSTRIKEQKERW